MKYIVAICASFLVAFTVVCAFPTRGESAIYDDVLRFHVIAESDTEEAQSLKLMVRDAALEYISERMTDCTTVSEACERVEENLDGIENTAEECARKNGYAGKVKAYLTKEEYPRRVYGDAVMPAGEYTSLRIVIGEGEGHNWWCVLFPTLCTGFSYSEEYIQTGFTPEEYRMITGGDRFKVKLRILEVIEGLLG